MSIRLIRVVAAAVLVWSSASSAPGQSTGVTQAAAFEVASVKLHTSDDQRMMMVALPIIQFTPYLAPSVNRVVIDRTGIQGRYDIELKWLPEQAQPVGPGAGQQSGNQERPSIFTALREQLGLKLESTREMVEVLVIDTIAHPTPN